MKSNAILVSLLAVLAVISLVSVASATTLSIDKVTVNGVDVDEILGPNLVGEVGETIPVRVELLAGNGSNADVTNEVIATDAIVKVELLSEDSEAETDKFYMLENRPYVKTLSLKLPEKLDKTPAEDYKLKVTVETKQGDESATYDFTVQRVSYKLDILNVEVENSAIAGNALALDIVIKNRGSHDSEDTFVVARIPSLGIERKAYFGDLVPTDDDDNEDAAERRMFLNIPSSAAPGIYTLEVEASNDDTTETVTKKVVISNAEEEATQVLTSVTSKEVAKGSSVTYDLIIVNSGNKIGVYSIIPETATNVVVSVDQPIITVPAGSSRTVTITAKAGDSIGTYPLAVNVESNGKLVKRVALSANVVAGSVIPSGNNVVVLTIVLAIIFVVLLVVLIVLLTRKPEKSEEFSESYY